MYVRVQSSLCVYVSGAGLLYENQGPLSARLFRAPVFLRPNSGSTPAPVRHSDRAQILRDKLLLNGYTRTVLDDVRDHYLGRTRCWNYLRTHGSSID